MSKRVMRAIRHWYRERKRWAIVGVTITGEQVEPDGRPRYWTRSAAHWACWDLLANKDKGVESWTEVQVTQESRPVLARMSELSR